MKINLKRTNDKFLLEGTGASGNKVMIDHSGMSPVQGVSPMELILMGVGSCSAIDIIDILKKQRQQIESYDVEVTGERYELDQAKPFKAMYCKVILKGDVDLQKAQRAADLSFEKYCSVSKTFDQCVDITWEVFVQ